jgi:hypothetical protein
MGSVMGLYAALFLFSVEEDCTARADFLPRLRLVSLLRDNEEGFGYMSIVWGGK